MEQRYSSLSPIWSCHAAAIPALSLPKGREPYRLKYLKGEIHLLWITFPVGLHRHVHTISAIAVPPLTAFGTSKAAQSALTGVSSGTISLPIWKRESFCASLSNQI